MPNVTVTPKVILEMALMALGSKPTIARNMTRSLSKEFGKSTYKIGDTAKFFKPYRFAGGRGIDFDPEPIVDQIGSATVDQTPHVHFNWGIIERTLDVREAFKLYAEPVAMALSAQIETGAATFAANNALNSVGTPGTAPTTEATYLAAGDVLVEGGLPEDEDVQLYINRRMSTAFVSGTKTLFNDVGAISRQWKQGEMQSSLGYKVLRSQMLNSHVNGTFAGTPLVNLAQQAEGGNNATMTLNTDGWSSTSLKLGDKYTIGSSSSATVGGVEAVHPQTRVSTGRQQVFTVQADIADSSGTINMVVAPAITPSGQYQNVNIAAPDNGIITMIGTTGVTSTQGLLMHKNAFAFLSVPLAEPPSGSGVKSTMVTDPETGLSMMHTVFTDGRPMTINHRFDCLVGYAKIYPEMAVVIQA